MKLASSSLSIILLSQCTPAAAFFPTKGLVQQSFKSQIISSGSTVVLHKPQCATALQMSIPSIINTVQRPRIAACALAFLLLAVKVVRDPRAFFWPGAGVDSQSKAALPEGSLGCPFVGYDIFSGSKDYGPFAKLGQLSKKNGKIFKIYSYGYPLVSVSGVDNIKSLLKNEFKDDGICTFMIGKQNIGKIFGENMVLYENNNEKHSMLRRLVGTAMTPGAIAAGIPSIQERANYHINEMLKTNQAVKFEDAFQSFTLDIAWKQILGLDLKEEDIPKFHDAVRDWTDGMLNPFFLVPFKVPGLEKYTKAGRAATYLRGKIEEKISKLEKDGPDSSTLSKLYYATDEDGTRLTREQVIDNSLLLIFAGTETSASTLTCAALFLTLHPDVWNKVRAEQNEIKAKYGDDLTSEALENSVYLDAVIKETLRLQPVELGELRKVKESVVVDGKQIPKKWYAFFNVKQTHYNDPSTYQEDGSHMDHFKGFKPDRWLSESTKPKEWMPFGDGRRRCIGERLGMTEMKVFLSMLARKVAKCELVNTIDADHEIVWQKGNAMARPANAECTLVAA